MTNVIVLDTSALLFWTLDPDQLSEKARQSIAQVDKIVISSISIWEIGSKVKHHKILLPLSFEEYFSRLQQVERLEILPIDTQSWVDNLNLTWDHHDPADRTIVALAERYNCPLVTSDHIIAEFYPETIW
jgi:PIN domain nuclease of toxin-antitoxin system